jgi:endoglucanase
VKRWTAATGHPLLDTFLWLKIPGQSDGECFRWTEGLLNPARGRRAQPRETNHQPPRIFKNLKVN